MQRTKRRTRTARLILAATVILVATGAGWLVYSLPDGTWDRWVESLSVGTLLAALTVLPIFGFPISVLHIATGARFGLLLGTAAVAVTTLAHLIATYLLARALEAPLRRMLATFGWHLPHVPAGAAWAFGFWIALLPGVSYALKNAVPPLTAISLRVYVATALPTHVATAFIGLGIGRATVEFSWTLLVTIGVYATLIALLTRRLARHFRKPPKGHGEEAVIALRQTPDHIPSEGGLR